MSNCETAIQLINSLSPSEKRHFRLTTNKHAGDKNYLLLYSIIEKLHPATSSTQVVTAFAKRSKGASIEATSKYLVRIITDKLVEAKTEKDKEFNLYHNLLRVKVLQERSLQEPAYKELKRIKQAAADAQHSILQYTIGRLELNLLSAQRFAGITDTELVSMQMKAKETLRLIHNIEGHYSLYEMLRYRLIHMGKVISDEQKKQLNDLLLSEISLVTGKVKNSFESRKLHLLFQSFYFTDIADFKSALKSFNELNRLFEQHPGLHDNPPLDYFSALEGILDSLRTVEQYDQLSFYIEKLKKIDTTAVPDYFRSLVDKTIVIFTLAALTGEGDYDAAVHYVASVNPAIVSSYQLVNSEKQAELDFYCALAYFGKKEYKKAHRILQAALNTDKDFLHPINKAIRLLNIIIYYELKDTRYLEYGIRSYTRASRQKSQLGKCEKLVFKTISLHPYGNVAAKNKILFKKIEPVIKAIRLDKYEGQLIKYFDFTDWAAGKFVKQ